jgi:phage internal scaffolding protein
MSKTKARKVKSAYTRTRIQTNHGERKTKAVQSERKHSDINNIVAKAYQTGQLPVLMGRKHVESMPDVETYQDALNKVVFAQQQFERLPSHIRAEFENKPENMLSAIERSQNDPQLKQKLQEIGMLDKPEPIPHPSIPAEQSGEAASGGEATAEPSSAPVSTASEGG